MYPVPLVPPDLQRLMRQGEVRRISHGAVTVEDVLERARVAMAEQDDDE